MLLTKWPETSNFDFGFIYITSKAKQSDLQF